MSDVAGQTATIEPANSEPPGPPKAPTRPRGRRRWLIAIVTVAAVVASGLGAFGAFWASVELPPLPVLPATTTLYYADGVTVLARLGETQRTELRYEEILPTVVDVAVAAEDPAFWSNRGGPITRAVVRNAYDIVDTGSNAQLRIWVMARKLEARHSKEEILSWYLNVVPFGRQAYGIEAAARAYFGKSASTAAPAEEQLTAAEAMVLLAMVREPYGEPGFDPSAGPAAEENSRQRWTEIRDALAELARSGRATGLGSAEVSALTYPTSVLPSAGPSGLERPVGLVPGHVLAELTNAAGSHFEGWTWEALRGGGYEITTTIDVNAQQALETAADETVQGSLMNGQPENLQAAGVLVEPGTGRVLGFYGGHDGTGMDYAGVYRGEAGMWIGFGAHPPGASFMVYVLAAALRAGYSLDSQWQWTPHAQVGRSPENAVRNYSRCDSNPDGSTCSLLDSVVYSLNVPLYDVTVSVGVPDVLTTARDAGITALWTDELEHVDLTSADPNEAADLFGFELGLGQYPVTVLDQAIAMATLAGGGVPAPAHFVREVRKGDQLLYGESLPSPSDEPILSADQLADLTYALTSASGQADLALKTGVWEYAAGPGGNSHAWSIGFTSAVAAAIWVGNREQEQPLYDKEGNAIWGSGLPSQILRQVVTEAQAEMNQSPQPFPPRS
jgi:membrane peptidoglycan carboxypeptidase